MKLKNKFSISPIFKQINVFNPVHFISLGCGSGLIKPASGTWGTLFGWLIGCLFLYFTLDKQNYYEEVYVSLSLFILSLILFFVGWWCADRTGKALKEHDHNSIVIDEIVAIFLVLSFLPYFNLLWCFIAFVLFRVFDILKPPPVSYFDEKFENGFGVMFDDIIAAIFTILTLKFLYSLNYLH